MSTPGSVLIVDDDESLRESLMRNLDRSGMRVYGAASVDDARVSLEMLDFDVLVTDLRLTGADGIDLLRAAREISPRTRSILMSAFASARDHELATELGAVCVLSKPFTPNDLQEAIEHALESRSGFRGRVHGLSLIDMLQMFHYGKRSISVLLSGRVGAVHVEDGEIIDAQWGELGGEEALARILSVDSGSLRTRPLVPVERTIRRPFSALLLEMLRLDDESSSGTVVAPDTCSSGSDTPLDDSSDIQISPDLDWELDESVSQRYATHLIDKVCKQAVERTDDGVACGVVDLDTATLLAIHKRDDRPDNSSSSRPHTLDKIVAASVMDCFRGPHINGLEHAYGSQPEAQEELACRFEEAYVSTKHNRYFMKMLMSGNAVIVLVTTKTTSADVGWGILESAMRDIEPHVP